MNTDIEVTRRDLFFNTSSAQFSKTTRKLVIEKSQFIRISLLIATIQPPPYSN